ncbi:SPX domain-containing protein 4 [Capsicum baccatum]|uniref:SPX domain-containing protein 4 n=1 Tax=Capsicum baccatum TaxID=33114 RepID=A0A2G2XCF7_CAPBA|nr:SPX domain-containing protein 4 [Capsicum baccatum]
MITSADLIFSKASGKGLGNPPPPAPPPVSAELQDWFIRILNKELEKFNDFYVDKEEDFIIRFQELKERIEHVKEKSGQDGVLATDNEFSEEMMSIRLVKILKNYDKRTGGLLRMPFTQVALHQPIFTTETLTRLVRECEDNLEVLFPLEGKVVELAALADMPAVVQLEKYAKYALAYQLLKIFLTGRLDDYLNFQEASSELLKTYDLGMMEAGQIPYSTIKDTLKIDDIEVESWVVKAISAELLVCKIDQMNQVIIVSQCTERVFGPNQWQLLREKLAIWRVYALRSSLVTTKGFCGVASTPLFLTRRFRVRFLKMGSFTFFLSVVMIGELLLSASSVTHAAVNSSVADASGELMNELDDINWEVSLASDGNTISYKGLQRPPVCNEKIYGNCIGEKKPGQRPCNYYNYCKRPG